MRKKNLKKVCEKLEAIFFELYGYVPEEYIICDTEKRKIVIDEKAIPEDDELFKLFKELLETYGLPWDKWKYGIDFDGGYYFIQF